MPEIVLHEGADEELKAAAVFYESRRAGLGESFLERVSEGFELIRTQPLAGQVTFKNYRRVLIQQFLIQLFIESRLILSWSWL